jgi:hypothetical protein
MNITRPIFDLFRNAFQWGPPQEMQDMSVRRPLTESEKEDLRKNATKIVIQAANKIGL